MSYFYLATPYSKYEGGLEAAFRMAAETCAKLIRAGVPVFSPIAHTHPIAKMGGIDPLDHGIWLPVDDPMMRAACGLLVYKAPGWRRSFGIAQEIKAFRAMKKPVRAITAASINDAGVQAVLRYAAGLSEQHSPVAQLGERDPSAASDGVEVAGSSPAGAALHPVIECVRCGGMHFANVDCLPLARAEIEQGAASAVPLTDDAFEIPAFLRREKAPAEAAQP